MDTDSRRKERVILKMLADAGRPLGSTVIARKLGELGIDLRERMVRYYLEEMDRAGLTENLGRAGRRITERGLEELEKAPSVSGGTSIATKLEDLAYKMSFDPDTGLGTVILKTLSISRSSLNRARDVIDTVVKAELAFSKFVARPEMDGSDGGTNGKHVELGTVCCSSLSGALRAVGIPASLRFGGLLEIRNRKALRFTQIINFEGTSVDPVELFVRSGMMRILEASEEGSGVVGACFIEVPAGASSRLEAVLEKLAGRGLTGVLSVGRPGEALFDVPVAEERAGIVVAAGLNIFGALEEAGIESAGPTRVALYEFKNLVPVSELAEVRR